MCCASHPVSNDLTVLTLHLITIPSVCPRCQTVTDNEAHRPSTLLTLTPAAVPRRRMPAADASLRWVLPAVVTSMLAPAPTMTHVG